MTESEKSEIAKLRTEIAVLQQQIRGLENARDLQAKEYQRRLEELNHAHAKAEARNAEYLPRELFESTINEFRMWRREVDKTLSEAHGSKAGITAAVGIVLSLLALALAAIPLLS
jgi:chromosome segregation ATPase